MKSLKNLFTLLFLLLLSFTLSATGSNVLIKSIETDTTTFLIPASTAQTVYICTGSYAYAYHSRSDCPGLSNCKGEIRYTDVSTAVNSFSRRPCCRCWSNVQGNCKDDYASGAGGYGSGGGGGDGAVIVAAVVVVGSAIILSNDVYAYPVYSFSKEADKSYYDNASASNGTGYAFGFRKTFKHSALEYGLSLLKNTTTYRSGNGYSYSEETSRWGGHLNFVHHIFYNKTPEKLKLYVGPSINTVFEFGYGGLLGAEWRLLDRLKFDVRYEYTTQTNQIQAGLIFTYQKKYLWQR